MLLWDQLSSHALPSSSFSSLEVADGGKSDKIGPAKAALADFCKGRHPSYLTFVFLMTAPLPVLFPHASVASQRGGDREVSEECLHYLICKGCSTLIIPSYNLSSPCSPPDLGGLNGGLVGLQALALPRSGRRLCVSTHRCLTCWPHFLFHSETRFSSQTDARGRNA